MELKNKPAMRAYLQGEADIYATQWNGIPIHDLSPRDPDQVRQWRDFMAFRDQVREELSREREAAEQAAQEREAAEYRRIETEAHGLVMSEMDATLVERLKKATKALQQADSELSKARADMAALENEPPQSTGHAIVSHRRKQQELSELVEALEELRQEAQRAYDRAYADYHDTMGVIKSDLFQRFRQERRALKERYQADDKALQARMHALGGV
jgi:DNA repair exonuclease SbcCD ATPase subunit